MKKNIIYILIVLMVFGLVACNRETELPDNKDTNEKNSFVLSVYDKPDGPFEYFEYAIVYFSTGIENRPYQDYVDALWADANFESDDWNYDEYSKLTNQPTIYLVYKSKEKLLSDFENIQNIVALAEEVSVYLNTVDMNYLVTQDSRKNDLLELMDYYKFTEIEMEQIPFEQLYLSTKTALVSGTQALNSFDEYIAFSPDNLFELTKNFFVENSLIIAGKDRSGSLKIRSVDRLFTIEDGKLEIAINSYSQSQKFTEDIQYWTVAISVKKSVLVGIEAIIIDQHTTFGNGYLADVPFHNTKEKSS